MPVCNLEKSILAALLAAISACVRMGLRGNELFAAGRLSGADSTARQQSGALGVKIHKRHALYWLVCLVVPKS